MSPALSQGLKPVRVSAIAIARPKVPSVLPLLLPKCCLSIGLASPVSPGIPGDGPLCILSFPFLSRKSCVFDLLFGFQVRLASEFSSSPHSI